MHRAGAGAGGRRLLDLLIFERLELWRLLQRLAGQLRLHQQFALGLLLRQAGPRQADRLGADAEEAADIDHRRSEEPTSELQSLMRTSYCVFCFKKKKTMKQTHPTTNLHT